MSYTILTVPFNLKEKAEGDFLKKGFVVDDRIEDYFGKITDNKGYIYGGEFSRSLINKAVVKSFLDLKLENSNTKPRLNYAESQNHVLEKISLYDKKYLKPFEIYTNLNPIERELIPDNDFIKALVNKLDGQGKLIFRTNIADRNTNNQYFKIDSVKIFFNRQNTNKGVGYGFISVTIEWIEDNVSTGLIQQIEPIKEFLRFYGKGDNSSMFLPFFDGKKDKKEQVEHLNNKMDKLAEENVDFSVIANSIRFSEDDFQLKKGLHFKLIVDELLKFFLADENKFKMAFDFNDRLTKPYLLYLDSTTSFDTSGDGLPFKSN